MEGQVDGKTVSARVGATDGGEEWLRKEGKEQEQKSKEERGPCARAYECIIFGRDR